MDKKMKEKDFVNTPDVLESFDEIINSFGQKATTSQLDVLVDKADRIMQHAPPILSEKNISVYLKERAKALDKVLRDYFTEALSLKFPILSPDIFDLKRYICIEYEKKGVLIAKDYASLKKFERSNDASDTLSSVRKKFNEDKPNNGQVVEVPLFAYVSLLDDKDEVELGTFQKTEGRYNNTLQLTAKWPGLAGAILKEKMGNAIKTYYTTIGNAYSDNTIREILLQNKEFQKEIQHPDVGALWIPTANSLQVEYSKELIRKNDPAMILRALGNNYLVTTWNMDDEEPFEKYLDFFTKNTGVKKAENN